MASKRSADIDLQKTNAIIVDVEGTTTSISFVKDKLFPYAREKLSEYIEKHWEDAEFKDAFALLREQARQDAEDELEGTVLIPEHTDASAKEAVVKNVLWQMDCDRKTTSLKRLQGHILHEGYKKGELKGHVYPDVLPSLKNWIELGKSVYVYSSGSVESQKLLFGHSVAGDLLEYFSGHFDTSVGLKWEKQSYQKITEKLNRKSEEIVFLTDIIKEARAATDAGMKAILVAREGNAPLTEEDSAGFELIKSFEDLVFEVPSKKKRLEVSCENGTDNKKVKEAEKVTPQAEAVSDLPEENSKEKDVDMVAVEESADVSMSENGTSAEETKVEDPKKEKEPVENNITKTDSSASNGEVTEKANTKIEEVSKEEKSDKEEKGEEAKEVPNNVPETEEAKEEKGKETKELANNVPETEEVNCNNTEDKVPETKKSETEASASVDKPETADKPLENVDSEEHQTAVAENDKSEPKAASKPASEKVPAEGDTVETAVPSKESKEPEGKASEKDNVNVESVKEKDESTESTPKEIKEKKEKKVDDKIKKAEEDKDTEAKKPAAEQSVGQEDKPKTSETEIVADPKAAEDKVSAASNESSETNAETEKKVDEVKADVKETVAPEKTDETEQDKCNDVPNSEDEKTEVVAKDEDKTPTLSELESADETNATEDVTESSDKPKEAAEANSKTETNDVEMTDVSKASDAEKTEEPATNHTEDGVESKSNHVNGSVEDAKENDVQMSDVTNGEDGVAETEPEVKKVEVKEAGEEIASGDAKCDVTIKDVPPAKTPVAVEES